MSSLSQIRQGFHKSSWDQCSFLSCPIFKTFTRKNNVLIIELDLSLSNLFLLRIDHRLCAQFFFVCFFFVHEGCGWNTWSGEHYEAVVGAVRNERHYRLITAGSARSNTSWTQPIFLVVLATGMACGSHGFIKGRNLKNGCVRCLVTKIYNILYDSVFLYDTTLKPSRLKYSQDI